MHATVVITSSLTKVGYKVMLVEVSPASRVWLIPHGDCECPMRNQTTHYHIRVIHLFLFSLHGRPPELLVQVYIKDYSSCFSRSKLLNFHIVPNKLVTLIFITYVCVVRCSIWVAVVYSDQATGWTIGVQILAHALDLSLLGSGAHQPPVQ